MTEIVGTGLVNYDRPSFDWWYPKHLAELMQLVDHLYVRIDDDPAPVLPHLEPYEDRITWELQTDTPRFQEDLERNALLDWALDTGAEWCITLDTDEVIEDGGGAVLRQWLESDPECGCFSLQLHYSSHHRPGYILPVGGKAWRGYRLDDKARAYRYQADEDGLHCGTVPAYDRPSYRGLKNPKIIHYHATTPEEWLAEREFYDNTAEVRNHGGIDVLYPLCGDGPPWGCDDYPRFGKESDGFPIEDLGKDRADRFARITRGAERVPRTEVLA